MSGEHAEKDKQTVRNFFRLLQEGRMNDWISLWADDGVNVWPYHCGLLPERMDGKDAILEGWKGVPNLFDSMDFPISEMWVDRESRTVVARVESHNVMRGGSIRYENMYVVIFKFNDQGKIKEYLEYFNPITVGETFGLIRVEKLQNP